LTQWAANSEWMRSPRPASECDLGVTFVGAAHGDRPARMDELVRAGIDVHCFGEGWPSGPVSQERLHDIFNRSLVSLNFAGSYGRKQIKARTFEVPGAGGFLLTEYAKHLEEFYRQGDEIEVFRTSKELIEKLRWILGHPEDRDRIARAGHLRTVNEHTYEARWRAILTTALARTAGRKPTLGPVEADAILDQLLAKHRRGSVLRFAAELATRPFVWIWGQERGRRAARRLLYEVMRRFAGERIFRAAGWPGRLFYRES
jgi:spore maturation protein CgeB